MGNRDLQLDSDGDLDVSGHELQLTPVGTESVRQQLTSRLQLWQGEWFLDQNKGVPYTRTVMVKSPVLSAIETLLRSVITSCPGVVALQKFSLSKPTKDRVLKVSFAVRAVTGDVIEVSDFEVAP